MRKAFNQDGVPRKTRTDCKFFLLPDAGRDEFLAIVNANRTSPNVEQLQAVAAKYGVDWSTKNIYEFLKGPRLEEQLIASQIRFQRGLGEALADSGADKLHTDSRRLAIGHWMTILRSAQVIYSDPNTAAAAKATAYAAASDATDKLVALGALKAGEDKGALALAKLKLDEGRLALEIKKFQHQTVDAVLKAATDPKIQSIVAGAGNNDEKTEALGRALFGEDWDK